MKLLYDTDADTSSLKGKRIAIIGYGSQGSAQAFLLHRGGFEVAVGVRKDGASWDKVGHDRLSRMIIAEAVSWANVVQLLLPDEVQAEVYAQDIQPYLQPGKTLCFSHGFNICFKKIVPPKEVDVVLVAPMAIGPVMLRKAQEGSGVPGLIAVHQDASGHARDTALAFAKALSFTKAGVMEGTFLQEMVTDLFGEQAVLMGGMIELIRTAFDVLVEAGYPPELAYFSCVNEVKFIADIMQERGISGMLQKVSNTAEYGGRTGGKKLVDHATKSRMKDMLQRIEDGTFAEEWLAEYKAGMPNMQRWRKEDAAQLIERMGQRLRSSPND